MGHVSTLSREENGGRGGVVFSPQLLTVLIGGANLIWVVVFAVFMVIREADLNRLETSDRAVAAQIASLDQKMVALLEQSAEAQAASNEELRARITRVEGNQDWVLKTLGGKNR